MLFHTLPRAHPGLAAVWWALAILRALLPAVLIVATGLLIGAVDAGDPIGARLTLVAVCFVLTQVLSPIHDAVSTNLGARVAGLLHGYVSAKLRERGDPGDRMTLIARLPAWLKSAKHRDEVLRVLARLHDPEPSTGRR